MRKYFKKLLNDIREIDPLLERPRLSKRISLYFRYRINKIKATFLKIRNWKHICYKAISKSPLLSEPLAYFQDVKKTWKSWKEAAKSLSLAKSIHLFLDEVASFPSRKKVAKTPTFLQMEATECGSICLSIMLAYYKHELTPEEARTACGVSRDGSKASHIVRAARQFNMKARGLSIKDIEGINECPWPSIIHWNFDHFVILEGRKGNYYYINDPATGRRRVDFNEFDSHFTGILLALTPGPNFVERTLENPFLQFLSLSIKRGVRGILAAFFLSILQILPALLIAFAGKVFIDYILIKNMSNWLVQLTIILALCITTQIILMAIQQRLLVRLGMHFKLSIQSLIVHRLFHLPLRFFDQRFSGDILYRLTAAEQLSTLLSLDIMGALANVFGIVIFTIILSQLAPTLFLIMLGFVAIRIIVFQLSRQSIRESNIHYEQQSGKISGIEMNGLDLMETLKANNIEQTFFKNWAANHDIGLNKRQRVNMVDQRTNIMLTSLSALLTVTLLYQGTYLVMNEQITIGTLIAFMTLSIYLETPIMTMLDFTGKIEKIKATINRFNDVLRHEADDALSTDENQVHEDLPTLESEILLKDITFGYAPLDPPIFTNLTISIPQGKTTAIVGISGSGKSTISKVICGLYPIATGEIFWDDRPIEHLSVGHRNKRISLVDQDIFLFDGSVRDNLTAWNKKIEDETLIEALKLVGLYDELLPRGLLNSHVGENGANLSGGQRQRLEIARALIRKTDVLILDEATSALDIVNEQHIFDSLKNLKITTIIIAHRLSTIEHSDIIYVLNQGMVSQKGSHKELSKKPGIYQELIKLEVA